MLLLMTRESERERERENKKNKITQMSVVPCSNLRRVLATYLRSSNDGKLQLGVTAHTS